MSVARKMAPHLRFLRPYSYQVVMSSRYSAYLRFYELSTAGIKSLECRRKKTTSNGHKTSSEDASEDRSVFVDARIRELKAAGLLNYPRVSFNHKTLTPRQFYAKFGRKTSMQDLATPVLPHTVNGRVMFIRRFGSKFFFVQIVHNGESIQAMVNLTKMLDEPPVEKFNALASLIRRGDHISVTGQPARTDSGDFALEAQYVPQILTPSIAPLPYKPPEGHRMHNKHLDLLLDKEARDIMVIRHYIINQLRSYFIKTAGFLEVQTPILSSNAGGAIARPFNTYATEFSQKELALRVSPELWMKRLVVGGLDRVFEIGPAFRNEGLDATHNPEFTVCEFYQAYANLPLLLRLTEHIFAAVAQAVAEAIKKFHLSVSPPSPEHFNGSINGRFEQVEFIPALERELECPLPNLESPTAVDDMIQMLEARGKDWHTSLPPNPSLPKLLDHLAAVIIEPQSSDRPLFITHHPVCMSPLAKSFKCSLTGQQVSARAELFFDGNELANMYEEENDPFEQRRKLVGQAAAKLARQEGEATDNGQEPSHVIDEQYLSVLESGLPPTGGWGCGVDRLVMLFTGQKRISQVLPFGNLRHVVGLHSSGSQRDLIRVRQLASELRTHYEQRSESHLNSDKSRGPGGAKAKTDTTPSNHRFNVFDLDDLVLPPSDIEQDRKW